jgi:hypothetical protein
MQCVTFLRCTGFEVLATCQDERLAALFGTHPHYLQLATEHLIVNVLQNSPLICCQIVLHRVIVEVVELLFQNAGLGRLGMGSVDHRLAGLIEDLLSSFPSRQ